MLTKHRRELDEEEDKYSAISSGDVSRIPSKNSVSRLGRTESRPSVLSVRSIGPVADDYRYEPHPVAAQKSSFTQSISNSINILRASWGIGIAVYVFCCGLTNYTAKILQKCLDIDPKSRTYGDMGIVIIADRLSKKTAPGSLIEPASYPHMSLT
ncbi:hypothetical protein BDF21DRAFT_448707 [Thamnidium elegans]|nr:hypothetical protein BDF21DRAFT_448707 [Thamnidium elegans]